jgi:hypothetical protein
MFDNQRNHLLGNLEPAHDAYQRAETFGGPSLYFHLKSLEAAGTRNLDRFAECIYATLASWGMHRMGKGGSKMRDFACFKDSLQGIWPLIVRLRNKLPTQLDDAGWCDLENIFKAIKCMSTATSLVGNSKVMAHALPNLVPPVDREYTLKFLYGHGNIKNGIEGEWKTLEQILRDFFYPVLQSPQFQAAARDWMQQPQPFVWDTSELKVIDNLIIGLVKLERSRPGEPASAAARPAEE